MKPKNLKLKTPKYNDRVVIDLAGDYNDADYTYSTTTVSPEGFDILMPLLKKTQGREWQDADLEDMAVEALEKLGIDEDHDLFDDVLGAVEDISLYSSDGGCHTMTIEGVYFESKDDNIRYEVEY